MRPPKLVIVGGVAGGMSCATRARRLNEDASIVVLERGPHPSFANCGLPYHIGGEIADAKKLVVQTAETLRRNFRLDVRTRHEVLGIDRGAKRVLVRELETGRDYDESYDALLISTGAAPIKPPIPGIDRPGHFTLRNIPDMQAIIDWIVSVKATRAVVCGGGYIGLEMVEQFRHRGLEVALAEALPQVMAPLDPEMAALLHEELREHKVALHLGDPVAAFEDPTEGAAASTVVLRSGVRLPADVVILGLGVKPDAGLARASGLEMGQLGGIRVDEYLTTSDPSIYAVGDAIEVRDRVTGLWTLVPLAGPANRQGRIVANNVFGRKMRYGATQGTGVLRLFRQTAGCTGANEKSLRKAGVAYRVVHLHPGSHAGYYPGAKPIALKLIFAPGDGRVLGAQAVGMDGVDKRIDVLATAIAGAMTVHDVAELELAYAPPIGSAKDPVNLAGMAAQNILDGLVDVATWNELTEEVVAGALVLDVREVAENAAGAIPDSVHIPLGQLRDRLSELPKDRPIIVHCASGQRSYNASRILKQKGFRVKNLSGSYKTWKAGTGV